jgi:hypothetical protein
LSFNIPILIIAWRRQESLLKVLQSLRMVSPRYVFIACDGARPDRPEEANIVSKVRETLQEEINWSCQVKKKFADKNQGCQRAVSSAVTWFFENVNEGIILEDDCVPHNDFFAFCSSLLEKYRYEEKVGCITGDNFQDGIRRGKASYYFSKYPHCWGWATWRRAWKKYSYNIEFWPKWKTSKSWLNFFENFNERCFWESLFDKQYNGLIDSWAYPWTASLWHSGCLTATPQENLVQNVGFANGATHTRETEIRLSVPTKRLWIENHPNKIQPNNQADRYVFNHVFCNKRKTYQRVFRFLQAARFILKKII